MQTIDFKNDSDAWVIVLSGVVISWIPCRNLALWTSYGLKRRFSLVWTSWKNYYHRLSLRWQKVEFGIPAERSTSWKIRCYPLLINQCKLSILDKYPLSCWLISPSMNFTLDTQTSCITLTFWYRYSKVSRSLRVTYINPGMSWDR